MAIWDKSIDRRDFLKTAGICRTAQHRDDGH